MRSQLTPARVIIAGAATAAVVGGAALAVPLPTTGGGASAQMRSPVGWSGVHVVTESGAAPSAVALSAGEVGIAWWDADRGFARVTRGKSDLGGAGARPFARGVAQGFTVARLGHGRFAIGSGGRESRVTVVDRRGATIRSSVLPGVAPTVRAMPHGHALVVFAQELEEGRRTAIVAEAIDAAGRVLGRHVVARGALHGSAVSAVSDPILATTARGAAAVVWRSVPEAPGEPVLLLSRLGTRGVPGVPIRITTPQTQISSDDIPPSVSIGPTGAIAVAWSAVPSRASGDDEPRQPVMRWLVGDATLGAPISLAPATSIPGAALAPVVETLDDDRALAVLTHDSSTITAAGVSRDGVVGPATTLRDGNPSATTVASNGKHTVVAWQEIDTSHSPTTSSIYAARLDGTAVEDVGVVARGRTGARYYVDPSATVGDGADAAVVFGAGDADYRGVRIVVRH